MTATLGDELIETTTSVVLPPAHLLRKEMNHITEAPGKVWFWELAAAVIDTDRCVQCGACIAACPSDSLAVSEAGLPELVKMCTGCSLCWDFCPRGGLRYEATWLTTEASANEATVQDESGVDGAGDPDPSADSWRIVGGAPGHGLGRVVERVAARTRESSRFASAGVQDGGVVTALLLANLEAGNIDGAVVSREDQLEPWKGVATFARTTGQIRAAAGSFYNQTMALGALDLTKAGISGDARIALVGTPCEVQGIRALQARPWHRGQSNVDAVVLTIALMCTKSFDYRQLMLEDLRDKRGFDLRKISKIDVIHGRLKVEDRSGALVLDEPIKDFHGSALKGCDECADFLGRGADLSIGSVGSEAGYSSILVRTEAGRRALEIVAPELEIGDLTRPEALLSLDRLDKKVTDRTLARPLEPGGAMFIDYAEHLAFYGGTSRAPVSD